MPNVDVFREIILPLIVGLAVVAIVSFWGRIAHSLSWYDVFRHGLVVLAATFVIGNVVGGYATTHTARTYTAQEIEESVKLWIQQTGFPNNAVPDHDSNFHFVLTYPGPVVVHVLNPKTLPGIIVVRGVLDIATGFTELTREWPTSERSALVLRLREKMLASGISYEGLDDPPKVIGLYETLAFTSSLTMVEFSRRAHLVHVAQKVLVNALDMERNRAGLPSAKHPARRAP